MMTSQILRITDSSKAQKSKYLENEILFFFQIRTSIHDTLRSIFCHKIGLQEEVTIKLFFH